MAIIQSICKSLELPSPSQQLISNTLFYGLTYIALIVLRRRVLLLNQNAKTGQITPLCKIIMKKETTMPMKQFTYRYCLASAACTLLTLLDIQVVNPWIRSNFKAKDAQSEDRPRQLWPLINPLVFCVALDIPLAICGVFLILRIDGERRLTQSSLNSLIT